MSEPRWIRFVERSTTGKTRAWNVVAKDDGYWLGEIVWHSPWRCFGFSPSDRSFFEHRCLRDIADFCEARTKEHRVARAANEGKS